MMLELPNSRALFTRTPTKRTPLIYRNSRIGIYMLVSGSHHTPFLRYQTLWLLDPKTKLGYPNQGTWYEPTGRSQPDVCGSICIYIWIYIYLYIHIYICTSTQLYVNISTVYVIYIYIYVYIYIYTYIYIYIYIHCRPREPPQLPCVVARLSEPTPSWCSATSSPELSTCT